MCTLFRLNWAKKMSWKKVTRNEASKQRRTWRDTKRNQRGKLSEEQRDVNRAKRRQAYKQQKLGGAAANCPENKVVLPKHAKAFAATIDNFIKAEMKLWCFRASFVHIV